MPKYNATGVHKIHSYFSTSGGVLTFFSDNASTQIAFGESLSGVDVKFFGNTASAYVLWDESADTLEGASSAVFAWSGAASFAGVAAFTNSVAIAGTFLTTGNIIVSGADIAVNSASIKLGNASTDRIGFFGATATVQGAKVATTGLASVIGIALIHRLEAVGILTATT